jgi:arginyl-tRNA synthetase
MNLKLELETRISEALSSLAGQSPCPALVAYSKSAQFGDYQANGVMSLAKKLGRNPRELAQQLVGQLDLSDVVAKVEVAGPGFINLFIKPEFLGGQLNGLDHNQLVASTTAPGTVVIDYSSPNLAKEMHVGHLRGTIIGDAIARTFDYLGHKLIRQNHFGDWGTQFGMLITHMQDVVGRHDFKLETELSSLEFFYREAKVRFDDDTVFAERARENVVKLQSGDPTCLALWRKFIEVSVAHCEELYKLLDITLQPTDMQPESFYNDRLDPVMQALLAQGLLRESDGAQCVFLDEFKTKEGEPLPVIVQKTGGGFLYATTDLAAIRYRCMELHAERVLYVVDARQSLHFQQVFKVAQLAGFANTNCSLEHLSYGTMMGKDGKPFKTRSGDTVKLVDLCDESIERAFMLVSSKNPDLAESERRTIAKAIGIGAVKYADLSKNRNSDYIFDWDSMLSFEGNTAPYLLYAYARIRSIFRRAGFDTEARYAINIESAEEQALALKLLQFTESVELLAEDCLPNQLCLYLYELSGLFMKFYEACPVLKAEGATQTSRLGLCQLTALTLKQGLNLLGISTLEQM